MTARRLIVNADDFGLTAGVDRGIARAVAAGAVTSVSVMANLADPAAVAALAAAHPALSLGAHLNLTTGRPLRPAHELPSLVDAHGEFLPLAVLTRRALSGRVRRADAARELGAQVAHLARHGIRVDHLDSHEHVHLLPGITAAVVDVARRSNVLRLRCHRPRLFPAGGRRSAAIARYYAAHPRRVVSHGVKRALAAWFRRAGLSGPDGVVSPALLLSPPPAGGPLDAWEAVLRSLPPGTWELVVHPADLDVPRDACDTARLGELVEQRGAELAALEGPFFAPLLAAYDVTLASFAAVPSGRVGRDVRAAPRAGEAHAGRA
jgi:predicted glycoside hydrolase/deacetylase ChbG (UPF0249 family)